MSSPATPRERRQERTRQAIVSTALKLLVEKGPHKLSLREIARRIDYSPAGLYEYFDSKDDLIQAVCDEADERLGAALRAVDARLPAGEYLVELGLAYIRFARQNPEHFTFLFTRREVEAPEQPVNADEFDTGNSFMVLYNAVRRAIDAGVIRTGEGYGLMEIAYSLWSIVHGAALLQTNSLYQFPLDFQAIDRKALQVYLQGLGQERI